MLRQFVGWIPGADELARQFRQVEDSVYELNGPEAPTMQILFFPGVSFDNSDAMLSTWLSEDGSCIWPQTWLAEEFPDAHVLAVSCKPLKPLGDLTIVKNILSDLLVAGIGQVPDCPLVLVGHSLGGMVIKLLCKLVYEGCFAGQNRLGKCELFLHNLRGIFFYATPHHGSPLMSRLYLNNLDPFLPPPILFKRFPMIEFTEIRNSGRDQLNEYFDNLSRHYKWQVAGLGEGAPTNLGLLKDIIVPEASARTNGSFDLVEGADHFSITRPRSKISPSYFALTQFLHKVEAHQKSKWDEISNVQHLPGNIAHIESQVHEILGKLDTCKMLGLVGMGGSGKSTLAKAVFNKLCLKFEYSCFVPELHGGNFITSEEVWKHMHYRGKRVSEEETWSQLRRKSLLLVLDGVFGEVQPLLELVNLSSSSSRLIVTSRNTDFVRRLGADLYKVPLLGEENARKLFVSIAFLFSDTIPLKLGPLVDALVKKCQGLPLALEVCGRYLRGEEFEEVWEQTLVALNGLGGSGLKEIWATLRITYDNLSYREQQMFLDAATFFSIDGGWTLGRAKVVWKKGYDTNPIAVSQHWRTLVDRFLVEDVEDNENVKLHALLRSLGQRIADEPSNQGKRRNVTEWSMLLRQADDLYEQEVISLHPSMLSEGLSAEGEDSSVLSALTLQVDKKQGLEVSIPITIDGGKGLEDLLDLRGLNTPKHLVITNFPGSSLPGEIFQLVDLQQLEIQNCSHVKELPESLGQLINLGRLVILNCPSLSGVPDSLGRLEGLWHLRIQDCEGLKDFPGTLGHLSCLEQLIIWNCSGLTEIPDTIGQLWGLRHLVIQGCKSLKVLPQSLGQLKDLEHLVVSNCPRLTEIRSPIEQSWSLKYVRIQDCESLKILPETLKQLEDIENVTISNCSNVSTFLKACGDELLEARAPGRHCQQISTSMKYFIAALETEGRNSYLVSTEWLSNLQDHEKDKLESICKETGYRLTYRTTSNTYYERYGTDEHVQNTSTGNDVSTTDVTDNFCRPGDNATSSGVSQTSGDLLPDHFQSVHIDEGVDISGSSGVLNSTQEGMKSDDIQTCAPKNLQVDCSASEDFSETLAPEVSFRKAFVTKKFSDCSATFPKQVDLRISTTVEKNIRMPIYKFSVGKGIVRESVSLRVFVETTVSCCLRSDDNPKKVHVEISKIRGEMKYVDTAEPRNHDLF